MKQPKSFRLSAEAAGVLSRIDNATRYIEALVLARNQRAQQSLCYLQSIGWNSREILAACDVLNGTWELCKVPRWHGQSLADGQEYAQKWEISLERWSELSCQVSESELVAYALHEVVSEFWCGNTALEKMIRKINRESRGYFAYADIETGRD